MNQITRADCEALDRQDPLAHFRAEFSIPEGMIYLDGNSLGIKPKAALVRSREVVEQEWCASCPKLKKTAH